LIGKWIGNCDNAEKDEADKEDDALKQKEEKHPEWAISNFARQKEAETANKVDKEGMPEIWFWGEWEICALYIN
jgi:hypothetical protein